MKKYLLILCLTMSTFAMYSHTKSELYGLISSAFSEGRYQDAITLLNKGISENDKACYGRLAACYMNGIGVDQDLHKARNYAKKGSELRNSYSSLVLGYTYLYENANDSFKGLELAVPYFKDAFICDDEEADDSLYANAVGMIALYECMSNNFDECKKWLKAGLTDYPNDVTLNDQAATMYLQMEDYPNAVKCAKVGATSQSINSEFVLGWCMLNGAGIPKDETSGFKKIKKAALIGVSTDPMLALADCYYNGQGTPVDKAKAKEWYEKAAQNGNETARKILRTKY